LKFTLNILEKRSDGDDTDAEHRWPNYVFGGRMRTSTFALIIVFLLTWWVYDTYRPEPAPKPPPQQVVPPGFVPDPNYTWIPRSRVQPPPPTVTYTPTPTTTTPPPPPPPPPPPVTTTTTTTPPFELPKLPCILPAPFCPPSSSPTPPPPQQPLPGPGPVPPSPQPAS
jgi:hypothetical protein